MPRDSGQIAKLGREGTINLLRTSKQAIIAMAQTELTQWKEANLSTAVRADIPCAVVVCVPDENSPAVYIPVPLGVSGECAVKHAKQFVQTKDQRLSGIDYNLIFHKYGPDDSVVELGDESAIYSEEVILVVPEAEPHEPYLPPPPRTDGDDDG